MAAPTTDIGRPDFTWGTYGQGLLSDWWETTADLIWPQSVITYGRMRVDPQLKAVLQAYTLPIMRATWAIDPDGCKPEVAQRVADGLGVGILGNDKGPGPARRRGVIWHRHLRQVLNYLVYGHMPFERRYALQPDGFMQLDNLGERAPWTVAMMNINADGSLNTVEQVTQREPIPANRLVWYANNQIGANWAGESLLRPAFGAWLLKHEGWRVEATSIRRFGMGVPQVTAPPGATAAQVAQAQLLASQIRAGDQSGIGMPAGYQATLMGVTGSIPDGLSWIKYLDVAMAKMALVGLIELGQSDHGSKSLGETFLDLFLLALQSVADEIAETATSGMPGVPGIITDLVDQNWGTPDDPEPAPRLVCTDVGENYETNAQALQSLTMSGALTPDAGLDEWVRKTWRLPKRTDKWTPSSRGLPAGYGVSQNDEKSIPGIGQNGAPGAGGGGSAPPAGPGGGPAGPAPAGGSGAAGDGGAPAGPGGTTAASAPPPFTGTALQRNYLAASHWEPDRHQRDWDEALAHLLNQYRNVFSAQRTDLVDQVLAALERGDTQIQLTVPPTGAGTTMVQQAMENLALRAARAMIEEAAAQGVTINMDDVRIDADRLGGVAAARTGVSASYLQQQATIKALQLYGPTPAGYVTAADEVSRFLAQLSDSTVKQQIGGALTAAQNMGRTAVLEAAPEGGPNVTYVAAEWLDKNTCAHCRAEDGHEYLTLQDAEQAYPTGGFKDCEGLMRCRGTIIAVWGDETTTTEAERQQLPPQPVGAAFNPAEPRGPGGKWLHDLQFTHVFHGGSDHHHEVIAHIPHANQRVQHDAELPAGRYPVGSLRWKDNKRVGERAALPTVSGVNVKEKYLRRGVATGMWEHARTVEPQLRHADVHSKDGDAWIKALGEKPPEGGLRTGTGRLAAQTPSQFIHPDTGHKMGKTEIGDTYEALFHAKGAHLLEAKFGGPYRLISGESKAGGGRGARNTPLDFALDHLFGGELKTLNAKAANQKTAIKAEEVARKDAAAKAADLKPLLVVQVVNPDTGSVEVYSYPAFASKRTTAMTHLGGYSYKSEDFRAAQEASGHWAKRTARAAEQKLMAASDEAERTAPDGPPVDPAPQAGDTVIELRDGVPFIGPADDGYRAGAYSDVTDRWLGKKFLHNVWGAFSPDEMRDPKTGKWVRDPEGKFLHHAVKDLEHQQRVSFNGHVVDRTKAGYTVKLKSGERQHYDSAEHAAEAARLGKHLTAGDLGKGAGGGGHPKPEPVPEPGKFAVGDTVGFSDGKGWAHAGVIHELRPDGKSAVVHHGPGNKLVSVVALDKLSRPKHQPPKPLAFDRGFATETLTQVTKDYGGDTYGWQKDVAAGRVERVTVPANKVRLLQEPFPGKVSEYADRLKNGEDVGPPVAVRSGDLYLLLDGNHRASARVNAGATTLDVNLVTPGVRKPEPPKPEPKPLPHAAALAEVDKGLARFSAGGHIRPGVLSSSSPELGALRLQLDDMSVNQDSLGVRFTRSALNPNAHKDESTKVLVALDDKGGIAGAVSFRQMGDHAFIDYLGSTGTTPGTGTALVHAVAGYAAERNLGVVGMAQNAGADTFNRKLGWHDDPMKSGSSLVSGWTPAEAKAVAARGVKHPEPKPPEPKPGPVHEIGDTVGVTVGGHEYPGSVKHVGSDWAEVTYLDSSGRTQRERVPLTALRKPQPGEKIVPPPGPKPPAGIDWKASGTNWHHGKGADGKEYSLHYAQGGGWDVFQGTHSGTGTLPPKPLHHAKSAKDAKAWAAQHAAGTVVDHGPPPKPGDVKRDLPAPDHGPAPQPGDVRKDLAPPPVAGGDPESMRHMSAWVNANLNPQVHAVAAQIYGTPVSRWTTTRVMKSNEWAGVMRWNGEMGLTPETAQGVAEAFHPDPKHPITDKGQGVRILWHEKHHAIGAKLYSQGGQAEAADYQTKAGHDYEEGFTELGTHLTMGEFLKANGIADRPMIVGNLNAPARFGKLNLISDLKDAATDVQRHVAALNGKGTLTVEEQDQRTRLRLAAIKISNAYKAVNGVEPDHAERTREAIRALESAGVRGYSQAMTRHSGRLVDSVTPSTTIGAWVDKVTTPAELSGANKNGTVSGALISYRDLVYRAYNFTDGIAKIEARRDGKPAGTLDSRFGRVKELAKEVNARSGPYKRHMMVSQLISALELSPQAFQMVTYKGQRTTLAEALSQALSDNYSAPGDPLNKLLSVLRNMQHTGELPKTRVDMTAL